MEVRKIPFHRDPKRVRASASTALLTRRAFVAFSTVHAVSMAPTVSRVLAALLPNGYIALPHIARDAGLKS
jgi:hypothetical protein